MKYNTNNNCINCGYTGHTFRNCKYPIVSYGIIGYTITDKIRYLLVQRKDTMGFIDFVRAKYDNKFKKSDILKVLVGEMTHSEKLKLLNCDFDTIWSDMWMNKNSRIYKYDYETAKKKFQSIDTEHLIESTLSETKWLETEYSIPKGRKNNAEYTLDCAIREFCEETGLRKDNIKISNNVNSIEEVFYGSNGIVYKHVYFLAEINTTIIPEINYKCVLQAGEVKNIKWFNYKDAMNVFRNYDTTKRAVIHKVNKLLSSF